MAKRAHAPLLGMVVLLLCCHTAAAADPTAVELTQAARRAAASGAYGYAIQALLRAHARSGEGALLFEIAEAHRRRHAREPNLYDLAQAVASYERYLSATPPTAPRREEARERIAELEPILQADPPTPDQMAEGRRPITRLGVLASPLVAEASVDDGPFEPAPRFVEVEPGEHHVVVRAPEHEPAKRRIRLARGGIAAVVVELEPAPAELIVTGAEDAEVRIDGRLVALPEDGEPLRLSPGAHFIAVTQTGFRPFSRTLRLERGARRVLDVDLEATGQHAAAVIMLTAGGAGLTAGIVFGALSVAADRSGRSDQAGDFRLASGIAGVSGVLLLVSGGTLLLLDEPTVPQPGERAAAEGGLAITPLLGPSLLGAGLSLTF